MSRPRADLISYTVSPRDNNIFAGGGFGGLSETKVYRLRIDLDANAEFVSRMEAWFRSEGMDVTTEGRSRELPPAPRTLSRTPPQLDDGIIDATFVEDEEG